MVTLILYIADEQSLHSERLQLLQKNNEQEKTGKTLGKILPGNSIIFFIATFINNIRDNFHYIYSVLH